MATATDAIDCSVPGVLALLGDALSADAARRERGETALLAAVKRGDGALKSLLAIACGGWTETTATTSTRDAEAVRTLACVTVKRRCTPRAFASRLTRGERDEAKRALLDRAMTAESKALRNAVLDVIAKIARWTVPQGEWNELLEFMGQCASSPEAAHRALAFKLFESLTETIVSSLSHHFKTLAGLFANGLVDAQDEVRVSALRAVGALVANASGEPEEVAVIKSLVPHVLEAAKTAVSNEDEESASIVFEVLDALTESRTSALSGHVPAVVGFCIQVATAERELGTSARRRALDVLAYMARHKPKALTKSKLVEPMLTVLCPLCGEPKEAELAGEDDLEDEDEVHIQTVASQLIDILALKVPAKYVLPTVLSFAAANINNASNDRLRHAAVAVLGVVTEGCAEGVRAHASTIVPSVVGRLSDPNGPVRGAAAFTLGQFAEHLGLTLEDPDMHKLVLPSLFAALPVEQVKSVQERMMYAMDAWLEDVQDEVGVYVKPLLDIVFLALDSGAKRHVREMLLSALASATASSGDKVHPYLGELLPRLDRCLSLTADEELNVRARALEVLGMLISAEGGKEAMGPHVENAMQAGLSGFELDFAELREYAHGLFGEVAEALKEDFDRYLAVCAQKAFESLEMDDGIMFDSEDEADREELDSDDDGDGADGMTRKPAGYSIRSGVMDEKASACKALNCYASHCPRAFAPYIAKASELLGGMTDYMHEMVRVQAHLALAQTTIAALSINPEGAKELVNDSLSATIRCVLEDEDRDAVAASVEAAALLVNILKEHRGVDVSQHVIDLTAASLEILEGNTFCQVEDGYDSEEGDEEGDEDEDEDVEAGLVVIEAVAELLPALAMYMGEAFATHFVPHFNALMKRTEENHTETERSLCYATLVEVVRAVGAPAAGCAVVALPRCLRDVTSLDVGLRRNSVYCIGILAQIGGASAIGFHGAIAEALAPMTRADRESDGGVRDNAVGAIARLLQAIDGGHARDNASALLDVVLNALPLRNDLEEGPDVYHWLASTITENPTSLADAAMTRIVGILAEVVTDGALAPIDTSRILGIALSRAEDPRARATLSSLPAPSQDAIRRAGA